MIYDGWKNATKESLGFGDPAVEEEAKRRVLICAKCPLFSLGVCSAFKSVKVKNEETKQYEQIRGCGCPLHMKVRSMESQCPLKKW